MEVEISTEVSKDLFYHYHAPTDYFYVERILPYLYTAEDEDIMPANGKCGTVKYYPEEVSGMDGLVSWDLDG